STASTSRRSAMPTAPGYRSAGPCNSHLWPAGLAALGSRRHDASMTEEFYRIQRLPPYVFAEVNAMKAAARTRGEDIIDLGMGNPDGAPPRHVVDKLCEVAGKPNAHRYSASRGIPGLRKAQAAYYQRRFGVTLDPDKEVIVTSALAYAEIYFGDTPTPSILQVEGAKDVAVEFTSMSKTYSMAGWRIGFAVGNPRLIEALARVKSYLDYGAFTPVQAAAVAA